MPKSTRSKHFVPPKPIYVVGALLLLADHDTLPVYFEKPLVIAAGERACLRLEIEEPEEKPCA